MTPTLIPPATHNEGAIPPVAVAIHPPTTALSRMPTNESNLRFLFAFVLNGLTSFGSDAISHSTLVTTTVGISLRHNVRLPTICPADWKLSSATVTSSFQSTWLATWVSEPLSTRAWISEAGMKISSAWMAKEVMYVLRLSGPRTRLRREKKRQPATKQAIEVRDSAQA